MGKKKSAVQPSTSEFTLPEEPTHAQLQSFYKSTAKREYMTAEQIKIAQICKEKLLNIGDIDAICPDVEKFGNMLETEGLGEYLCLAPQRFHPDLVVEFYEKARVSKHGDSFTTSIMGVPLLISPAVIGEVFGLRSEGVSIGQFRDSNPKAAEQAWEAWKLPEAGTYKVAAKTTQLQGYYKFLADFVTKCVSCDVGSMSEMSRRRWSIMMAMEARVEGNWAEFVFERLLEYSRANVSIQGARKVPATGVFHQKVNFGLKISFLIEKLIPGVGKEAGERLISSDWLPPNPSADQETSPELSGEEGYQQTLLRLPVLTALSEPRTAAAGGVTSTSTSTRPSLRKSVPEKRKKSTAPGLKRKAPEEPQVPRKERRVAAPEGRPIPRKKRSALTPSAARAVREAMSSTSSEEEEEVPQLVLKRRRRSLFQDVAAASTAPVTTVQEVSVASPETRTSGDEAVIRRAKGKQVVSTTSSASEDSLPEDRQQAASPGPAPAPVQAEPLRSYLPSAERAFVEGMMASDEEEEVQEIIPGLEFYRQQVAKHQAKMERLASARELLDEVTEKTFALLRAAQAKLQEEEEAEAAIAEILRLIDEKLAEALQEEEEAEAAAEVLRMVQERLAKALQEEEEAEAAAEAARAEAEALRLMEEIRVAQEAVEQAEALRKAEEAEAAEDIRKDVVAEAQPAEFVAEDIPESSAAPPEEGPSDEVITTIVPFKPIVLRPEPSSRPSSVPEELQQFMIGIAQTVEAKVNTLMKSLEETKRQQEELMRRDQERQQKEAFYDSSLATLFDIVKKGEEDRRRDKEERREKEKQMAEERLRQEKERLAKEAEEERLRSEQLEKMLKLIQDRLPASSASSSIPPP